MRLIVRPSQINLKCLILITTGMFFSLNSIGEAILPLGVLPLYDRVFTATVHIFPGAFYFCSAALTTLVFIMIGYVTILNFSFIIQPEYLI